MCAARQSSALEFVVNTRSLFDVCVFSHCWVSDWSCDTLTRAWASTIFETVWDTRRNVDVWAKLWLHLTCSTIRKCVESYHHKLDYKTCFVKKNETCQSRVLEGCVLCRPTTCWTSGWGARAQNAIWWISLSPRLSGDTVWYVLRWTDS